MTVDLATAYVSLVADTRTLARDLQRDLGQSGDRAGRQAGNDFSSSFNRGARNADPRLEQAGQGAGRAGGRAGSDFSSQFTRSTSGIGDGIDDALSSGSSRGGESGGGMGMSFLEGFGGKISSLGAAAGPIGTALAGVAAVGIAAGTALAGAVMDGFGQMQSRDLIQARLGVNEATMGVIGQAAGGAFSDAWGESVQANMETAQLAIQGGILNGEETAAGMQPVIEKLNVVNDLIGGDMATTVRATGSLMKNGLAKDAEGAFDLITKATQKGGAVADDLIDSVMEYGNGWKQTGFSGEFAMGLINQSMENGADNTDRAADAIREFGRRMYEESDKIQGAIGELGLPVDELFGKLQAGGPEAEAAFDQIFDSIRKIEDPTKRATVAQQLLGDTAGDFINAFTNWDPSKASLAFGTVEGAAQKAATTMSSNPMAQWESAMNTISVQADGLKLSLAEGFAPVVMDLANWMSEHKPEIIAFFTDLGSATLTTIDYFAAFTSGSLRMMSYFADGIGQAIGTSLQSLGGFGESVGGLIKHIPGMGDVGEAIEGVSQKTGDLGRGMQGAGDQARGLADKIDGSLRPGLQSARDDLNAAGDAAENSAWMMRELAGDVTEIPGSKDILIKDNSPETIERLRALGMKVETTPNGIRVTATTDEAQASIDNLVNQKRTAFIDVKSRLDSGEIDFGQAYSLTTGGTPRGMATGGLVSGPGSGTSDSILAMLSNGEFVSTAKATKQNRPLLEALNNGWVPPADMLHGMVPGYAAGGFVSADKLDSFARGVEGAEYEWGGVNWGDCSGAVSALANFATGADPFGSRFGTGNEGDSLAAMGFLPGLGPAGSLNVGWFNGGPYGGHTAATLPNGTNFEMGGARGNGQYGGQAAGAADAMFTDQMHLPPEAFLGGDPGVVGGAPSGPGASALGSPGGGGGGAAGGGGASGGSGGSGGGGGGTSSGATSVFVTNWPGTFAPREPEPTPTSTLTADTPAPEATPKPEDDPNRFDLNKRLGEYGTQVGEIGTNSALSILGLDGTIADPNHRYWQAARDTQTAFAEQADQQQGKGADNSIHIDQVITANVEELMRRLQQIQKAQAGGFIRR